MAPRAQSQRGSELRIAPFSLDDRDDLLASAMRAWEPEFPLAEEAVSPFVYRAFYLFEMWPVARYVKDISPQ